MPLNRVHGVGAQWLGAALLKHGHLRVDATQVPPSSSGPPAPPSAVLPPRHPHGTPGSARWVLAVPGCPP